MKFYFLSALLLFSYGFIKAQSLKNLITNPSFEDLNQCPVAYDQIDRATGWKKYRGSPDLFNACTRNPEVKIPKNFFGFAQPPTGGGYAGLVCFHTTTPNEVIGTKLIKPLKKGVTYRAGFKMCLGNIHSGLVTNNMGLLFTNSPESDTAARRAHVKVEKIIADNDGWYTLEGTYKAEDRYEYVIIGNFFLKEDCKTAIRPQAINTAAYYFIDDVFVEEVLIDPNVVVTGKLMDEDTKRPLEATVSYKNKEKPEISGKVKTEKGTYKMQVPKGTYELEITTQGYYPIYEQIVVEKEGELPVKSTATPLKTGKTIVINYIYFDYNKSELKPESGTSLEILLKILQENPTMQILIAGHTDNIGTQEDNLKLSASRAEAVKNYLLKNNISPSRITVKGFGPTQPVASNATDQGRAKNRRVEFTITKI